MEKKAFKVVSFLNRQELDFLDTLEKDIYFKYGIHIPRTKLIEEITQSLFQKDTPDNIKEGLVKKLLEKNTNLEKRGGRDV